MARRAESTDGLSHSLTDLMTSIAVIFILLFLVFLRNEQQEIESRKRQTVSNVDRLLAQLDGEMSAGVKIEEDPNDPLTLLIILRDNPELLSFSFGRDDVTPTSRRFLERFIPRLGRIVCSEEAEPIIDSLIIEGHTDSRGDNDLNTGLSARRATAVLIESRKILSELSETPSAEPSELESCFLRLARATGRGEQELILEDGEEHSDKSRRVVVKVRVKSLEQRENLAPNSQASLETA